jgi:hypothetical protein
MVADDAVEALGWVLNSNFKITGISTLADELVYNVVSVHIIFV